MFTPSPEMSRTSSHGDPIHSSSKAQSWSPPGKTSGRNSLQICDLGSLHLRQLNRQSHRRHLYLASQRQNRRPKISNCWRSSSETSRFRSMNSSKNSKESSPPPKFSPHSSN